jgi:hypothetical protein
MPVPGKGAVPDPGKGAVPVPGNGKQGEYSGEDHKQENRFRIPMGFFHQACTPDKRKAGGPEQTRRHNYPVITAA